MNVTYRWVNWEFNRGLWASLMRDEIAKHGVDFVAEVMGVSVNGVKTWAKMKGAAYSEFPYPNMTNFMKFCNEFNYDPREFFILEDI